MKLNDEATAASLIRMLKRGVEMMPFASQPRTMGGLLGVGAMGVVGLLLAMRKSEVRKFLTEWAPEGRGASEPVLTVAGLQNLGNNCFLNAILQALASCGYFHSFLQSMVRDLCLEGGIEEPPLTVALESLLEGLFAAREERTVLNPRKVMASMGVYLSNFSLTRQQDAAEALLHLLSSLQMEYLDHCVPFCSSIADIDNFLGSICHVADEKHNKLRKWQQQFLGPFDGTVGSILSCTGCSSQLSMDFEVFHCLPLSPVLDSSLSIMDDCSLEDCLSQYTAKEHLKSYRCSRCWHLNAVKYLSLREEDNQVNIKTIKRCGMLDSCDCKNFLNFEIPESSYSSHAFKQCCIARTPQILCLHLQRASISGIGELIKLEGHISFPMVLNLFPFTINSKKPFLESVQVHQQGFPKQQEYRPHSSHFSKDLNRHMTRYLDEHIVQATLTELPENCLGQDKNDWIANSLDQIPGSDSDDQARRNLTMPTSSSSTDLKGNEKVRGKSDSVGPESYLYCLVAAVEHYGRCGSGHYAVYRRMNTTTTSQCIPDDMRNLTQHWVYVSDSMVSKVSLETVLSAEASLLFYERVKM